MPVVPNTVKTTAALAIIISHVRVKLSATKKTMIDVRKVAAPNFMTFLILT